MASSQPGQGDEGDAEHSVNSTMLLEVQKMLGQDWKDLGRDLGIEEGRLQQLDMDNRGCVKEAIFQMLLMWKNRSTQVGTVGVLVRSLQFVGRFDIAEKILAMAAFMKHDNSKIEQQVSWKLQSPASGGNSLSLDQLQATLRRQYRMLRMKGLPWMENVVLSLKKHFVELEMVQKSRKFTQEGKKYIDIDQIFQSTSSCGEAPSRILVEGDAGFGKTTLASKLCHDYGNRQNYISHFDLVLFFSLRNFTGNLEEMLFNTAGVTDNQRNDFLEMINSKSVNVALILDGYDELPNELIDPILALIHGECFCRITLLVTSRPGRFTSSAISNSGKYLNMSRDVGFDVTKIWDKQTKLLGISEENQMKFLDKHLSNFSSERKEGVIRQVIKLKQQNILTLDFLQCPLFMLMIVLLLTGVENSSLYKLKTRTQLYKDVMNFVILRYMTKVASPITATTVDVFTLENAFNPFFTDVMKQFGQFSLSAIRSNSLSFTREQILEATTTKDSRILDLGVLTHNILVRGFLQEEHYEPVHKSLLEFAAAYFLWSIFISGSRDEWIRIVQSLRPTHSSTQSSLVIPFLTGLMGNEVPALFGALSGYAAEYSSMFGLLSLSLLETELTSSVLPSLTLFLPSSWIIDSDNPVFALSAQHSTLLHFGSQTRIIKQMYCHLNCAACISNDINVDRLILRIGNELPAANMRYFRHIQCRECRCVFYSNTSFVSEWKAFISLIASVRFQYFSFWLVNSFRNEIFLPLIYEAVTVGELKGAKLRWIKCEFSEETSILVDLLTDLIQKERVEALMITFSCFPSQQQLSSLFTSISKSSKLTRFLMHCRPDQETCPLTLDLARLCNGGQKSYKWIHIDNFKVECNLCSQNGTLQIGLLELRRMCPSVSIPSLLQSCRTTSFRGDSSILSGKYFFLHECLNELRIAADELFFNHELFKHLGWFSNLQFLTIFMISNDIDSVPVEKWLLEPLGCLLKLKALEIKCVERNPPLVMQIVTRMAMYLGQTAHLLQESGTSPTSASMPKRKRFQQLEYICLNTSTYCNLNNPSMSTSLSVLDVIYLASRLKHSLVEEVLPRLDLTTDEESFIKYMSKYTPNGYSSFVNVFPPEEGFVVKHDYVGMREDDSIMNREHYDLFLYNSHRFSVFYRKDSCSL